MPLRIQIFTRSSVSAQDLILHSVFITETSSRKKISSLKSGRILFLHKRNIKNKIIDREKLLVQLKKQEDNYRVLLDLFKKEFSSGEVSVIDYINVLKNYISFKTEFIQNKYRHMKSINEFNYWNW